MNNLQVARVTDRKGAKLHAVALATRCHIQQTRGTIGTSVAINIDNAPLVCRNCRPAILAAAQDAELEANQRAGHSTIPNGLGRARGIEALVLALETPAGRLARQRSADAFRAQFDAIVAANLTDLATAA